MSRTSLGQHDVPRTGVRVSETVSKKRGRPPAWIRATSAWQMATMLFPEDRDDRQRANRAYGLHATFALRDAWAPEFARFWRFEPCGLADLDAGVDAGKGRMVWTVLTALGRLGNSAAIVTVARRVAADEIADARGIAVRIPWLAARSEATP